MRRLGAALGVVLWLGACGKYGPPLRGPEAARARERAEERARALAEDAEREADAVAPGKTDAPKDAESEEEQ